MSFLPVVQELRKEIKIVLDDSINQRIESQNRMMANAAPRSLHYTGSFGCSVTQGGQVHINIPTGTDKTEKLEDIIDRVLMRELNVTLDQCRVIQNGVGMSNKVIKFVLPGGKPSVW